MTFYDLSWPVTDRPPCTFSQANKVPTLTFEEGDSHGLFFVTSRLDNLYSNAGTQIDFPAHLPHTERYVESPRRARYPTVGEFPLERFIGSAAVVDFSAKFEPLSEWFDAAGVLKRDRLMDVEQFLRALGALEISKDELIKSLQTIGATAQELHGILIYSGSGKFWVEKAYESWEYRYFYSPYLSMEAAEYITETDLSFIGIDAFQIEHPISNFRGDELPLVVNPGARSYCRDVNQERRGATNHDYLLGAGLLIYESLNLPTGVVGKMGTFSGPPLNLQLNGLDDDAMCRPYMIVE